MMHRNFEMKRASGLRQMRIQTSNNPKDISLFGDSILFKFLVRLRLIRPDREPLYVRAIFLALLTWLPLLVFSAIQGLAWGGAVKVPFVHDITISVRLLLALPLLIVADSVVGLRANQVLRHFVESGLVDGDDVPRYEALVRRLTGLVSSAAVMYLIVPLVVGTSIFLRLEFSEPSSTWQILVSPSGMTRTAAGWWHLVVSTPIFQFLLWRWLYRYLVWCWFLRGVSRLDLRLIATHPDQAGGLSFLGVFEVDFCPIIFAVASLISAHIGQEILFAGTSLRQYTMMILGNVLLMVTIFLGPYFVFSSKLFETMRRGFLAYSTLADDYTRSFERKWIGRKAPEGEPLLGSSDIQSLADLANSFAIIRNMRLVPFDLKLTIIPIVACAVIPFLPLALTVFPLEQIVEKIIGILL